MTFDEVAFPIYILDKEAIIQEEDGIVWMEGRVLDNKNVNEPSLGRRRLKSPITDLYPLKKSIHSLEELMRYSSPPKFIDSEGKLGVYNKSQRMPYKCHRVRKIVYKDEYCLVRLHGVNWPVWEKRPPQNFWAGVLYRKNVPWLVLEYFQEPFENTWRKI